MTASSPDDFLFNSRTLFSCFQAPDRDVQAPTLHSLVRKMAKDTAVGEMRNNNNKKSNLIGAKEISKTEESLSSLTGPPLHINERLGRTIS